jgi:translation initiation factor 1 (eIF-1/SUI1)
MSRPNDPRKKVDVSRSALASLSNPFAALGEVEALKNLAPPLEPPVAQPPAPEPVRIGQPKAPKPVIPKNSRGRLILRRETKDRGGKVVVVIYGFAELPGANAVMIADLARQLKGQLGVGGSFDRQEIVLQGDRCADVCAALENLGFRVDGVRS